MAPAQATARTEREKKVKSVLGGLLCATPEVDYSSYLAVFASSLATRINASHDATLVNDLQAHIRGLPFQSSSTIVTKQDELDKLGTELWNLSTRLSREGAKPNGKAKGDIVSRNLAICLLRAFSFLLLDSASGLSSRNRGRAACIRLMRVALKAAKVCIESNEFLVATKVLERAADYQNCLAKENGREKDGEEKLAKGLCVEYFAVRTALVRTILAHSRRSQPSDASS